MKLPLKPILIEGTFRANERGFGFVTIDPEEDDIYIPKEATGFAMDGDTVAIDIMKRANTDMDRGAGKVVEIRDRATTQLAGGIRCLFRRRNTRNGSLRRCYPER